MKLRTQMVVAFVVLAILPLGGIVLYSYVSSQEAVRGAVRAESQRVAGDMEKRMASVKDEISTRIAGLEHVPFQQLAPVSGSAATDPEVMAKLALRLGEAGRLIDSLEFLPAEPPQAPAIVIAPPAPAPPAPPAGPPDGVSATPATIETELGSFLLVPPARGDGLGDGDWQFRFMPAPPEVPPNDAEVAEKQQELAVAQTALRVVDALMEMGVEKLDEAITEKEQATVRGELTEARKRLAKEQEKVRAEAARGTAAAEEARTELEELRNKRDVVRMLHHAVKFGKSITDAEVAAMAEQRRKSRMILGRDFEVMLQQDGRFIGQVRATVSAQAILNEVLARTPRDDGAIPFAIDPDGQLYVGRQEDRAVLESIPIDADTLSTAGEHVEKAWIVVTMPDEDTGVVYGLARPVGDSIAQMKRVAARNFLYGIGLIGFALLGILPLSGHLTRNVNTLTRGAERIAQGDLRTRIDVRSPKEFGRLATAFNKMAADLSLNQERLLEEERRRKEQELERRLLEAENARRGNELEEARDFQLSLLPKSLPSHPSFDLAVLMRTATEVGGDYYDFRLEDAGTLTVVIGDATGHGARAGTMVTVVKSLFAAASPGSDLRGFLVDAARAIKSMDLGRMAMALALVRISDGKLSIASAGMPPLLIHRRATNQIDEIVLEGMPLGGLARFDYRQAELPLQSGDTLLLMSDGFPELLSPAGDVLGYARARELFAAAAHKPPAELIADLAAEASRWCGGGAPNDDVTFVTLRAV